ncbi:hypothetical protein [Nocardioides sp.]|uniref:hypothetical protein n=1 Tax=Nocardioides sp. TaxID=35761 RepID=UPI00271ACC89|nr:hypothetical protein [Nocardioides sp.]MDO9455216.1 hypothetical protein [Nocardioides sp.]
MLPPGVTYDKARHPPESAPIGEQQLITAPDAGLKRRRAADGTPYCACCDDTLLPSKGPGRPRATCGACTEDRRRARDTAYNDRKQAERAARSSGGQPHVGLTRADVQELSTLIDQLSLAVGRSSTHFQSQHEGTWQHALLLCSKDLVAWRESALPPVVTRRYENTDTD